MNQNFARLCRRSGGYSLPWLITISDGTTTLYFINDADDLSYGGNLYKASAFSYGPAASDNGFSGGGSLQIAAADANEVNSLIGLIEASDELSFDALGILLDDGTVNELKAFRHQHGRVSWNGRTASFTFDPDDRLGMTFPALIFSHYNNRGN